MSIARPDRTRSELAHSPADGLIAKLGNFISLSDEDIAALQAICTNVKHFPAKTEIIGDGERPRYLHLVISGWACRSKVLAESGIRQITAFLLPGDLCDMHVTVLGAMDHAIETISPVELALIDPRRLDELMYDRPHLLRAFWWATLVDEGVLRAWIVNIGRRDAYQRLSHLLCELYDRLDNVGMVTDGAYRLPIVQVAIADATGLTPVHVNRVIGRLKASKIIAIDKRILQVLDLERLRAIADYDGSYLHRIED